ncbi:hypothetical protein GS597_10335 [Synechococcales cyanobacterium C]|uniref:Uncharacterized protein n=1 Tax=Petrachloros mirabilis ULC683 TaxID=2781853 RepID=A0A8K1ZZE3_9CYAN|nr:hypothetical protein [Petrachloros mirabilis]NCJ06898.1 hypothetical protein [Petrachloros mirabilis ULC683]
MQPDRSSRFDLEILQSLPPEQLIAIVLQQQHTIGQPTLEPQEPGNMPKARVLRVSSPFKTPMGLLILGSAALHGLLLWIPLPMAPKPQSYSEQVEIPLVDLPAQEIPVPIPDGSAFMPPPVPKEVPNPQASVAKPPPTLQPTPAPKPLPAPQPQATVQDPAQPNPVPTQTEIQAERQDPAVNVSAPQPEPKPEPLAEIAGIPVFGEGQVIDGPTEVLDVSRAQNYLNRNGERHPHILGQFMVPTAANPEALLERYKSQLQENGFSVTPSGAYEGAPQYRLLPKNGESAKHITVESTSDQQAVLVTIWSRLPWQQE